ncbi:MAG: hypothetical protein V4490_00820 [Pseudomonadota bacterium]
MKISKKITGYTYSTLKLTCILVGALGLSGRLFATHYDIPFGTTATTTQALYDGDTISVEGTIDSVGLYAPAIDSTGTSNGFYGASDNTITVSSTGVVTASTIQAININGGANMTISNDGVITGTTENVAIYGGAFTGLTITNTNEIFGNSGVMAPSSASIQITNSGTIEATNIYAINTNDSENVTITNSGTLTAPNATVNEAYSTNVSIVNSGIISATCGDTAVIAANSTTFSINNTGTISASGQFAVSAEGSGGLSLTNSGLISAGGQTAIDGYTSEGMTITNTGTITSQDGTIVLDNGGVLINSGSIIATNAVLSDTPTAIYAMDDGVSVTIQAGSIIEGTIVADSNATNASLTIYTTPGGGSSYQYTGPWSVTLIYTSPSFNAQETADKVLFQRVSRVNDSFAARLSMPPGSYGTWAVPYGGQVVRSADATMSIAEPFRLTDGGITVGTSLPFESTLVDFVLNAQTSNLNINDNTEYIKSNSMMTGFLLPYIHSLKYNGILSGKFLVGFSNHHSTNGSMAAKYRSQQVLVGLESVWSKSLWNVLIFKLDTGLDFAAEQYNAYRESSLLFWYRRVLTQMSGHIELKTVYRADPYSDTEYWIGVRAAEQILVGGRSYDYLLTGNWGDNGQAHYDDFHTRGQVGMNIKLFEGTCVTASVDYTESRHHLKKYQGYVGVVFED